MSHVQKKNCLFIVLFAFCVQALSAIPVNLEASRAENIGAYPPNSFGVYPVMLKWRGVEGEGYTGYHVYRSLRADTGFERISQAPVNNESGGLYSFIDTNPLATPGKRFYYRVSPVLPEGGTSLFSESILGYGALTHVTYVLEFNKTLRSSMQKLIYMNKAGALAKLGSEQKSGSISGTLSYQSKVSGLGGRVTMHFDTYADFYIDENRDLGPYFILNGDINSSANMMQNGTMDGTLIASGMYPGRVHYDKVQIKKGAVAAGTYGVEPQGFPRVEIDWVIAAPLKDTQ